jgi:hypothetical protein
MLPDNIPRGPGTAGFKGPITSAARRRSNRLQQPASKEHTNANELCCCNPTPVTFLGDAFTKKESDALADLLEAVLHARKKAGEERRRRARLNQLRSIEQTRERYGTRSKDSRPLSD